MPNATGIAMRLVICDNAMCSTPCAGYNTCSSPADGARHREPGVRHRAVPKAGGVRGRLLDPALLPRARRWRARPTLRCGSVPPGSRSAPWPCVRRHPLDPSGWLAALAGGAAAAPPVVRAASATSTGAATRPPPPDGPATLGPAGYRGGRVPPGPRLGAADGPGGRDRRPRRRPVRGAVKEQQVFVSDLFNLFRSYCGACHVDSNQGRFQVTGQHLFDRDGPGQGPGDDETDDLLKVMPPPVAGGIGLLRARPPTTRCSICCASSRSGSTRASRRASSTWRRRRPGSSGPVEQRSSYLVSQQLAGQLTNLGSCVPGRGTTRRWPSRWTRSTPCSPRRPTLPDSLDETDLVSLDGEVLAQQGVVAFAPAYPLWSDNSAKMRRVRVPRGTSDPVRQGHAAVRHSRPTPASTRPSSRRSSTSTATRALPQDRDPPDRLPPGRAAGRRHRPGRPPCSAPTPGTTRRPRRAWCKDPLRNGEPFRDRLITYVTDEPRQRRSGRPPKPAETSATRWTTRTRAHPPLRHPRQPALHRVPHGQPQRRLRPRLHARCRSRRRPHGRGRRLRGRRAPTSSTSCSA